MVEPNSSSACKKGKNSQHKRNLLWTELHGQHTNEYEKTLCCIGSCADAEKRPWLQEGSGHNRVLSAVCSFPAHHVEKVAPKVQGYAHVRYAGHHAAGGKEEGYIDSKGKNLIKSLPSRHDTRSIAMAALDVRTIGRTT